MKSVSPIRCGLAVGFLLLGGTLRLGAQEAADDAAKPSGAVSSLPAARPTGAVVPATFPSSVPVSVQVPSSAPVQNPAPPAVHRAEITYTGGKLAVEATNASLNEILQDVANKTGMKISGGVADDRVFGSYGPSTPAVVLDALLEGTGSNVLLVDDAKGGAELILTPRHGGVTPPNPNAVQSNDSEDQGGGGGYVPPLRPFRPPVANGRGPITAGPDPQGQPAEADTNESGPKTPQQIFDQLQRTMQQQQRQVTQPPPE